jgi:CDP-glucose 4,6-dehydratase
MMENGFWRDRPVFITGATGLVGGWLTKRLLEQGASVTALVRDWVPASEFVHQGLADRVNIVRGGSQQSIPARTRAGRVRDRSRFSSGGTNDCRHREPQSAFDFREQRSRNWNLLESCRRSPLVKSVILASSDKAYGEQKALPYKEDMPLQGKHPYDVSKSCADLIAQSYAHTFGVPLAITRCGNFYGGGDLNWNRVVPGTIRSVIRGERPVIRSDGEFVRDYFYVEDGAAAYMLLAERLLRDSKLRGAAYNFSNEAQISVLQLVNAILEKMGSKLKPEIQNQASNEIRHQFLSAERARTELNWKPMFTLDEGLDKTIAWYREALK